VSPASGAEDDIAGFSFGEDFSSVGLPPLQFSVDRGSQGTAGSAVGIEAGCSPPEPHADAFETAFDGLNYQDLDGDGVACGGNAGFGLVLTETETTASDNVDALGRNPCLFVDLNCDGTPENPVYLVLAPGSPTLDMIGATPADILMTGVGYGPVVWAEGAVDLGLAMDDAIDALCIQESGNGVYDVGDQVAFSLAPGSPTLISLGASPAAVLRADPPSLAVSERVLGLVAADNLDALVCSSVLPANHLFLPLVLRNH
jgi:hypothetical protein